MVQYKEHVSAEAARNIEAWLTEPKYSEYRDELEQMIADKRWVDLEDAFYTKIVFGTGGVRGKVGVGSNCINRVSIGQAAQALCQYAQQYDSDARKKGIVIACDTRLSSPELTEYTARVCAANGFKVYVYDGFRSTPQLSFSVRNLGCAVGVVISASHNRPEYNGFKAYWNDGCQLVAPHDRGVVELAHAVDVIHEGDSFDTACAKGLITVLDERQDDAYIDRMIEELEGGKSQKRVLRIAYSPLHGAGQTNTLPVLVRAGFDVITVDEQMTPDGMFPTIADGRANPEAKAANKMVVEKMVKDGADIAITNDPDADRVGVMVRHRGETKYLNGNEALSLMAEYTLSTMQKRGVELDKKYFLAKTIVTTDLMQSIADEYGVSLYGNLLVGFKYVGEVVTKQTQQGGHFVVGGEESYGSLKGDYARDKDGAVSALCLAEYADALKQKGMTLYDALLGMYEKYGVFANTLTTMACEGAAGFKRMQAIMQSIRISPPKEVGGYRVAAIRDYKTSKRVCVLTGDEQVIDCTKGDVIMLEFEDSRRKLTIRPSGTEPIIKLYGQWYNDVNNNDVVSVVDGTHRALEDLLSVFVDDAMSRA